jgi:hypothetical protein
MNAPVKLREVVVKGPRSASTQPKGCETLGKSSVAELSAALINSMTCDELIRVIRAADLPTLFRPELQQSIPFYDRETLKRLAYLARRCCQKMSCDGSPSVIVGFEKASFG